MKKYRGMMIVLVLALGIGTKSQAAGAGHENSVAVTRAEFLPATLERDLDGVRKALVDVNGQEGMGFARGIAEAIDSWVSAVAAAKTRVDQSPTAANREALLRVLEQAVGDLAVRLESAASVPGEKLVAGFEEAHRRLAAVAATVNAKQADAERSAADGEGVADLERRARQVVQAFVAKGKKDQRLRTELLKIRVQLSMAPLREETRKSQAKLLAKLGGQLERFAEHAQSMREYVEASVVAMKELGSIYSELRDTIGYYRVAQGAIRDIASSGVSEVMTELSVIREKQQGILNAFKVAGDMAGSFDEYDGSVKKQQKALDEFNKTVGGDQDIEDMVRRYGDPRVSE